MVGVYVLVALALYGADSWFRYDITRHVALIRVARTERAARASSEGQLTILRRESDRADAALPALAALLPQQDALIDFPRKAVAFARQYGLDFSFTFGESTRGASTTPGYVAFSASGKGQGDKWVDFLKAFESSPNVVAVDTVQMRAGTAGSYDVTINGKVFSQ